MKKKTPDIYIKLHFRMLTTMSQTAAAQKVSGTPVPTGGDGERVDRVVASNNNNLLPPLLPGVQLSTLSLVEWYVKVWWVIDALYASAFPNNPQGKKEDQRKRARHLVRETTRKFPTGRFTVYFMDGHGRFMWSLIEAFLGIAPARLRDVRLVCVDIKEDAVNVHRETFPASVEHVCCDILDVPQRSTDVIYMNFMGTGDGPSRTRILKTVSSLPGPVMVSFSVRGHKRLKNFDGTLSPYGLKHKLSKMGLTEVSTFGVFYSCFRLAPPEETSTSPEPSRKRKRRNESQSPRRLRRRVVLSDEED